mmetsp:Transcript_128052/g.249518  ORF Transcript_128052/g.249518 Transcript_128052/m.249518 type:complete len:97 (-) Transcript_128052:7-297(-)
MMPRSGMSVPTMMPMMTMMPPVPQTPSRVDPMQNSPVYDGPSVAQQLQFGVAAAHTVHAAQAQAQANAAASNNSQTALTSSQGHPLDVTGNPTTAT